MSSSLANNGWAAASQLPNMTENERKSLLLAKLSFHYNRTVHTEFELSNRKVGKSTYLPTTDLPQSAHPSVLVNDISTLLAYIYARCPPRVAVCVVLLQFTRQQSAPHSLCSRLSCLQTDDQSDHSNFCLVEISVLQRSEGGASQCHGIRSRVGENILRCRPFGYLLHL